ncbi:MAG: hypothetical protein CMJ25_20180 [Phycisphaerae bacterium]|nr:hypothetical protein [Phycisphaerae bacterium]
MATLKVTLKEELVLNGKDVGNENFLSVPGVTQSFGRIVTLPNGGTATVAVIKSAVTTSAGALDDGDVKYIRITNLDADNTVTLSLQICPNANDATDQAVLLLQPGKSFMMGSTVDSIGIDGDHTAGPTLNDLESIKAINNAGSDTTQLEVFIAS